MNYNEHMTSRKDLYRSYGMKSLGILLLGGIAGFFVGSTIEFYKNLSKTYEHEYLGSPEV